MRKTIYSYQLPACLATGIVVCATLLAFGARAKSSFYDQQSAAAGIQYLANAMDQFHNRFPVYDDVSSAGNHFHTLTKFPSGNALVTINGSYSLDKHSGATSIRCTFIPGGVNFGGYNFQNGVLPAGTTAPIPNFGTVLNAGINLTGTTSLTFWARGQNGGEVIDFFMGGVGWNGNEVNNPCVPGFPGPCPAPDSTPAVKITVTLSTQWTQYSIGLAGRDLSYVLGGFSWGVDGALNPAGAVFYLDDIQYELSPARRAQRLDEPRFIRSFTTLPLQPNVHDGNQDDDIDLVLRNAAFIYDNALAVLAFLADGSDDSLRRARLIGDAIVYATAHDRTFDDGRLRSAYAAGDIALPPGWTPNNRVGTVPVAGFYEDLLMQFFELGESRQFDTGNQAWAMISLLALYRNTGDVRYLNAARLPGNLIHSFRNDTGLYQGFLGGLDYANGDSATPNVRNYASTEHNLDVFAAFSMMRGLTGESVWQTDAQHAQQFVEAMWDSVKVCYLTGTNNPNERNTNPDQLPVDVQAWSVLALPNTLTLHPQVLNCAEVNHQTVHDGFSGFDFNNDKDGVWFEGTAQMAVAYAWANQLPQAASFLQELRRAQTTQLFGDGFGISAACHDAVTTGFGFKLFRRLHAGATAWLVFAESGFNPYYFIKGAPTCQTTIFPLNQGFNAGGGSDTVSVIVGGGCNWQAISQVNWITITSGNTGNGSGIVNYSVAPNNGPARTGTMTIAGQIFTVTQAACTYSINPTSQGFPISGGTGTVTVTTTTGCPWTATSNVPWLTTSSSGVGNGTASYSVAANTGAARTGTITIAGQTFTVTQLGIALQYYPLPSPVRLLDTRPDPTFPSCFDSSTPLVGGSVFTLPVAGNCNGLTIPASAKAVVGNATVVNFQSGGGFITLFPSDAPLPNASNLNFTANHIVPNSFTVGLGSDGALKIFTSASTNFIVDITGYYAPPGAGGLYFHPLPFPVRMLDTRPDPFTSCVPSSTPLAGGGTLTLPVAGNCNGLTIPASAKALVGNATVVNFQSGGGFITLFPSDATLPNASNLNFTANHIVPNSFVVGLGPDGAFKIFTSAATNFIVDIAGYFSDQEFDVNGQGLVFYPLSAPARWLDTRPDPFVSCIPSNTPLGAGSITTLQAQMTCEGRVIPATAKSVLGNATVVNFQSAGGFITLFPSDATLPNASNLNFTANHIVPNSFVVGLSPNGAFNIFTSAATNFIIDLSGYFAP